MEFKKGDKIYRIYVSCSKKKIIEYEIVKVNKMSINAINDGGIVTTIDNDRFNLSTRIINDSCIQFCKDLTEADRLSLQLMDVIIDIRFNRLKKIRKEIDNALKIRNSAPIIRRLNKETLNGFYAYEG
jgi:hypothetical protein